MTSVSGQIGIVGCGFVADLYMKSLALYPDLSVVAAFDHNPERLEAFCRYWQIEAAASVQAVLAAAPDVVCNLTNPSSHYAVTKELLLAGVSVYSEKPLAMEMDEARELCELAEAKALRLAAAPCSVLSDTAETLRQVIADGTAGPIRLVYAELDDGFIPQAPYDKWLSASGAPWPFEDEFKVGCTVEHAGYYLTWLVACFGPVETVVASSSVVIPDKLDEPVDTPDFSVAVLHFQSGVVARLTCSIVAPHNHRLLLIGDRGNLEVDEAWNNNVGVRFRRRLTVRRRLMAAPIARRVKMRGARQLRVGRAGAASMNFALGPIDMLNAIKAGQPSRLDPAFCLHINEITLAIQNSGSKSGAQSMTTTCRPLKPLA